MMDWIVRLRCANPIYVYRCLARFKPARQIRPAVRRNTEAGSGIDVVPPRGPLKPRLPESLRPVSKSPPLVQSFEMVLVSIVTAAFSAMARPQRIFAVVFKVMLWAARIFPANAVLVPRSFIYF